ncbi:hypothetical protein ATANTOWER_029581 [Ataeniobius toweri]|uniref:Uncharacterized protein n=1 Tax=Ataeniobius toweri TaxID=208326 RepID=A0ABU7CG33_9TELE|nr:hypothetical protein [Ataeniobius toweri]
MSCTLAVRIIRSSNGTCSPMRPAWWSNCQRTFILLIYTGSPKLLVPRSRHRLRFLPSPAQMVCTSYI